MVKGKRQRRPFVCGNFRRTLAELNKARVNYYACGVGKNLVTITPAGEIYPCHRFAGCSHYKMGELGKGMNMAMRQKFFAAHVDNRSTCKVCWARYLCGGGCLNDASTNNGEFGEPEPFACRLQKLTIELSIYIYASVPTQFFTQGRQAPLKLPDVQC